MCGGWAAEISSIGQDGLANSGSLRRVGRSVTAVRIRFVPIGMLLVANGECVQCARQ